MIKVGLIGCGAVASFCHWPALRRMRHVTVVAARSGEEALRVVRDQELDVVILNTSLPDLSGFEVLRQIRQISDAPVILLSDGHNETDQVRGLPTPPCLICRRYPRTPRRCSVGYRLTCSIPPRTARTDATYLVRRVGPAGIEPATLEL